MNDGLARDKDGHLQVCAACLGHRWMVFLVIDDYGKRPVVKSCQICNKDGKASPGMIEDNRRILAKGDI